MKRKTFSLLAIALFFTLTSEKCDKAKAEAAAAASSGGTATAPAKGDELIGPRWNLSTIAGEAIRLPEGVENPFLGLTADNGVHGYTGCNKLMGTAKIDGSSLSFPGVGGTKMFCERTKDVEDAFLTALRSTNSYKLKDGRLILLDKSKELATFVKVD